MRFMRLELEKQTCSLTSKLHPLRLKKYLLINLELVLKDYLLIQIFILLKLRDIDLTQGKIYI